MIIEFADGETVDTKQIASIAEAEAITDKLKNDLDNLETHIERAKVKSAQQSEFYTHPGIFYNAVRVAKAKRRQYQKMLSIVAQMKKDERLARMEAISAQAQARKYPNKLDRHAVTCIRFVDLARERLSADEFNSILIVAVSDTA